VFDISLAFERITDVELRKWKRLCSFKGLSDLIFDEEPYKVYTAKVTGEPSLKYIPFDEYDKETGKTVRVYRGEGNI
jgi:hypothetical protein